MLLPSVPIHKSPHPTPPMRVHVCVCARVCVCLCVGALLHFEKCHVMILCCCHLGSMAECGSPAASIDNMSFTDTRQLQRTTTNVTTRYYYYW